EYWVIGQAVVSVGFLLLPVGRIEPFPQPLRWGGAAVLGSIAAILGSAGIWQLGENLTPLPQPKEGGQLVTTGVYRWVRHPIYSSVIFLALAYAVWRASWTHLLGTGMLFLFFDRKAAQEEAWLTAKFPEYETYRQQVKKLIPGLY
ncbi:MAG: isoprenylcysteine carboxylmethyltransferase family protein, partial [Gloeomargarita sp. SKYG116]|nr:isoprenylcysteine carboxylmethyltransferase family protein [Gloeomargarita sp. SKYG116]MDW8402373.1 isoprenylcysteine carboxylmethyltransferase family protein [Gloeomargarita sp. SKYGB_i_bin116]